jgi:hypothetical protein
MRKITTPSNRPYLLWAVIAAIVQITIFKIAYPFPDFISDSYDYIESAAYHLNVNLWPIGYAKFLWLVHQVSASDTFLVCVQYFILEAALAYLFFFIIRLFRPSRTSESILFVFLLVNPFALYISNAVLSDALFTALTIVWLVQLIQQFVRPNPRNVFLMAIVIGIAFTIRYTAIYYPIVTGLALLLSRNRIWVKVAGTLAPLALMVPFVLFTQAQTKAITGTAEFSVFGGWQLANNAMYMYGHIKVDPKDLPPATRGLDSMVKDYYKGAPPGYFNFDDFPGTFFIKHQHAPLKQYMNVHFAKEVNSNYFKGWGMVSPIYNKYGTWLMTHYPVSFARYYLWLNVKNYFDPYLEKFDVYNLGEDSVWPTAQYWFHWETPAVTSISKDFQSKLFFSYVPLFLLVNIYFAGCMLWLLFTGRIRRLDPVFRTTLYFLAGFLIVNFGFSVFATPIVLRYQLVPLIFLFTFSILLMEFTDQKAFAKQDAGGALRGEKARVGETALLTFGILAPFGILGGIFCLLLLVIMLIVNILSFLFLLGCGLSSLIYGYLSRNFDHLLVRHKNS